MIDFSLFIAPELQIYFLWNERPDFVRSKKNTSSEDIEKKKGSGAIK